MAMIAENGGMPVNRTAELAPDSGVNKDIYEAFDAVSTEGTLLPYLDYATPSFADTAGATLQELIVGQTDPSGAAAALQEDYGAVRAGPRPDDVRTDRRSPTRSGLPGFPGGAGRLGRPGWLGAPGWPGAPGGPGWPGWPGRLYGTGRPGWLGGPRARPPRDAGGTRAQPGQRPPRSTCRRHPPPSATHRPTLRRRAGAADAVPVPAAGVPGLRRVRAVPAGQGRAVLPVRVEGLRLLHLRGARELRGPRRGRGLPRGDP